MQEYYNNQNQLREEFVKFKQMLVRQEVAKGIKVPDSENVERASISNEEKKDYTHAKEITFTTGGYSKEDISLLADKMASLVPKRPYAALIEHLKEEREKYRFDMLS